MFGILYVVMTLHGGLLANGEQRSYIAYDQGQPYNILLTKIDSEQDIYLADRAALAFKDLSDAALSSGFDLKVNNGFRSMDEQEFWFSKYRYMCRKSKRYCGLAARPGWSTHQRGVSVDLAGTRIFLSFEEINRKRRIKNGIKSWIAEGACSKAPGGVLCKTKLYYWLKENAAEYGFINDVEREPWHWTYVGINN